MKLEQNELDAINELIVKYNNQHDDIIRVELSIKELETNLKSLNEKKDKLLNTIEDNRDLERTIVKALVDKYGEGKLDVQTLEWITNEK